MYHYKGFSMAYIRRLSSLCFGRQFVLVFLYELYCCSSGTSDSSMCPGVDSASKNEYQDVPGGKDGRCVKVTTLPFSCAECLEILEP
jgi:hypothetical protein